MSVFTDNVDAQIKILEDRLIDIEVRYIGPHTNPLASPSSYALDVQSYALLCHAAFEEFAERLSLEMVNHIEESFSLHRQISKATLCFLYFNFGKGPISVDDWNQRDRLFDHIKEELRNRKSKISEYAMVNNHGVNIKYLQHLFLPLGLDLPIGNEKNSLEQLARLRGFYAHAHSTTFPNAVNVVAPQMAVNFVMDVLDYMNSVAEKLKTMSFYLW